MDTVVSRKAAEVGDCSGVNFTVGCNSKRLLLTVTENLYVELAINFI